MVLPNQENAFNEIYCDVDSVLLQELWENMKEIKEKIEFLQTDQNIKDVNHGFCGSIKTRIEMPVGKIPYITRENGLKYGLEIGSWCVINSIYNREPFLNDISTLVNKTVYLIRYMFSIDDFNWFPLSLISDPIDNAEAGFKMINVLLSKDRGHFMTVLFIMCHQNKKFNKEFWQKVRTKLVEKTNKGKSTTKALKDFQDNTFLEILKNQNTDELSLRDIVPEQYYNKIYNDTESISIRLETRATHSSEIAALNDEENGHKAHNFGLRGLTDAQIDEGYWKFNLPELEQYCFGSASLLGQKAFLQSRKGAKFSGYETEPVFLYLTKGDLTFDDYKIYQHFAGSTKDFRPKEYREAIIHEKTTADAELVVKLIDSVADLKYGATINCLWTTLHDTLTQSEKKWQESMKNKTGEDKTCGHFAKLKGSSLDTGLLYLSIGDYLVPKLGSRVGSSSSVNNLKYFLDWFIDQITKYQDQFWKRVTDASVSWKGRYSILKKYVDEYIQHKEAEQGQTRTKDSLRQSKLTDLRSKYTSRNRPWRGWWYDRTPARGWFITEYNLEDGTGVDLCHYIADINGGRYTVLNTDIGPVNDNRHFVGKDNICNNYFTTDGDFWKSFLTEQKDNVDRDDDKEWEAYMNTKFFVEANSSLFEDRKKLNLNAEEVFEFE
jgi:hypothetical protein